MKKNKTFVPIMMVALLFGGVLVSILAAQQNQEQRSKAAFTEKYRANSPQQGETWQQGTTHVINWIPGSSGGTVRILLINVAQWKYTNIAPSAPDSGSYTWTIPTSVPSTEYMIYVECTSCGTPKLYGYGNKFFINGGFVSPTGPTPTSIVASPLPTVTGSVTAAPSVTSAPSNKKDASDLNDDGKVNQVDYNLFLREIATQPGN